MQDEFAFIKQFTSLFPSQRVETLVPNGDDAAVFKPKQGQAQVICVDTLVEGIHFKRQTMSPEQIGYKSLAVNLSDLAAMGARPSYFLVSLAVPPQGWSESELLMLFQGMKRLADKWQMELLGGDLVTSSTGLMITVTALGELDERVRLLRSHARVGHLIFVTGYLGQSGAGLDFLLQQERRAALFSTQEQKEVLQPLLKAHQTPHPHLQQGEILAQFALEHRLALNDVSDGLASEAHELASSSQVQLIIEKEKLPLSQALAAYAERTSQDPYEWMLNAGEDFVLVGTLPANILAQVEKSFQMANLPLYVIGSVSEGREGVWLRENGELFPIEKSGYNHFSKGIGWLNGGHSSGNKNS